MSTADSTENSSTNDILAPTDLDEDPLLWDGNNAKILGLLYGCDKNYLRKGQFQPFFQHRAVLLRNGKIAVPSKATIPFIMGELDDGRTFANLCPAIDERKADIDSERLALSLKPVDWNTITTPTEIIVSKLYSDQEDGKLLRSLTYVFGHADQSEELIEAAAGSGTALLKALRDLAATASVPDKAVVSTTFNRIKAEGIQGEITTSSLSAFVKAYKKAKTDLEPSLQKALGSDDR